MDLVKVTCYNRTETMTRKDAIQKYTEAMAWSDGSELQRYAMIMSGLLSGLSEVSDEQ